MEMHDIDTLMDRTSTEQRHAAVRYAQLWREDGDTAGANAVMDISFVIYILQHLVRESRPDRSFKWGTVQQAITILEKLLK